MVKVIELIVVATLLIFAFFAGVKYSDSVKNHASWLFEPKEEEVELPDLSNENLQENGAPMDDNAAPMNAQNPSAAPAATPAMEPMDSAIEENAAPARP